MQRKRIPTRHPEAIMNQHSFVSRIGLVGRRPLPIVLVLFGSLVVAATSCGPFAREPRSGWDIAQRGAEQFVLQVENRNFADARLYARWNGDRRRIGTVGGNQTEYFTLDWDSRQLRLEVDFLAGASIVSPSILVSRGDTVVFQIPPRAP
jgi:hypothetical protein